MSLLITDHFIITLAELTVSMGTAINEHPLMTIIMKVNVEILMLQDTPSLFIFYSSVRLLSAAGFYLNHPLPPRFIIYI